MNEGLLLELLNEVKAVRALLYAQAQRDMERQDYDRALMRQAQQDQKGIPSGAPVSPPPVRPSKDPVRELLKG